MNHIREQIYILCKIQDICTQKQKMLDRIENIPNRISSIHENIKNFRNILEIEKNLLISSEDEYRRYEHILEECTVSVRKSKEKLRQIKNNKEYQSTLKEIELLSKKKSDLEDIMLQNLEKIDNLKESLSQKIKFLSIKKEKLIKKKDDILHDEIEINLSLKRLNEKKRKIRISTDPIILSIFDNVNKKVQGMPIAPVRNSVCFGCNMSIPPQLYNELQKFDELKYCPYCRRIVYWNEEI